MKKPTRKGIKKFLKDNEEKILKLIIFFSILGLIFFMFIEPAISSTIDSKRGTSLTSDRTRAYYKPYEDEIVVLVENDTLRYKIFYTHENCHRQQHINGRLEYSYIGRLVNELECYIKQWFFWNWEDE